MIAKKHLWLFLVLLFVGYSAKVSWDMHQQYNGVCISLGRQLTDEEKVRAVIEEMNRPTVVDISFLKDKKISREDIAYYRIKSIPYVSVDEFLKENPNCCSVKVQNTYSGNSDPNERTTGFDRAMGGYAGHIVVNYKINFVDENGIVAQKP